MTQGIYIALLCIGAVCIGVGGVLAWRAGLGKKARALLLPYVREAEVAFGSQAGRAKLAHVLERLYAYMPASFARLFPTETVIAWVEEAVRLMKQQAEEDTHEAGT